MCARGKTHGTAISCRSRGRYAALHSNAGMLFRRSMLVWQKDKMVFLYLKSSPAGERASNRQCFYVISRFLIDGMNQLPESVTIESGTLQNSKSSVSQCCAAPVEFILRLLVRMKSGVPWSINYNHFHKERDATEMARVTSASVSTGLF